MNSQKRISWLVLLSVLICVSIGAFGIQAAKSQSKVNTLNSNRYGSLAISASISPSVVAMDVNRSQLFTATVTGGTSPFNYHWYLNGGVVIGATNATWTFAPSSIGFYTVYCNVTDSTSSVAVSNIANVTVTVPSVAIRPWRRGGMDLGVTAYFLSTASNGTAPYLYQWFLNGTAVPGASAANWNFTPGSVGTYDVYVNVTDSVNFSVLSNTVVLSVRSAPSISISPTSAALDAGHSLLFTATISGGLPPYTVQWWIGGVLVRQGDISSLSYTFNSVGFYQVYAVVTDGYLSQATSNIASVTVTSLGLSVIISPISVTFVSSQSQLFSSSISGDPGPYAYQWYLNGIAVPGATGSTWNSTWTSYGSYTVYLNVTDGAGLTEKSNVATVSFDPAVPEPFFEPFIVTLLMLTAIIALLMFKRRSKSIY